MKVGQRVPLRFTNLPSVDQMRTVSRLRERRKVLTFILYVKMGI